MTPNPLAGLGAGSPQGSPSPYNQISQMGNVDPSQQNQQSSDQNQTSPSDKFVTDFGSLVEQIKNLTQTYKGGDEETQNFLDAAAKWAASAAQQLNSPQAPSRMY